MARKSLTHAFLIIGMGLGGLPACGADLPAFGCSDRDVKFAPTLKQLSIFEAHPDHVVELNSYSGCDPDDGAAYIDQFYLAPLGRAEVLDFYRVAAEKEDWRFDTDSGARSSCYSKAVDGTTAYLRIWFPGDLGDAKGAPVPSPAVGASSQSVYEVEVRASHDGEASC